MNPPAARPHRQPKSGETPEFANARRSTCRKLRAAKRAACEAATPAPAQSIRMLRAELRPSSRNREQAGATRNRTARIPRSPVSKTTADAEINGPSRGQFMGCVGSSMSLPRKNGEEGMLRNGINGMVAAKGASQRAAASLRQSRCIGISLHHPMFAVYFSPKRITWRPELAILTYRRFLTCCLSRFSGPAVQYVHAAVADGLPSAVCGVGVWKRRLKDMYDLTQLAPGVTRRGRGNLRAWKERRNPRWLRTWR